MPATLVAHRGYPACCPENTMVSFQSAFDAGASWLETDVQFSRDGQPMLYHDGTLQRTSQHDGAPWDFDALRLSEIGAAYKDRFGEQFAAEPIPTLNDLAQWAESRPSVRLMIELKPETLDRFGTDKTVATVLATIQHLTSRCVLISKDTQCLRRARRSEDVRIGWVLPAWSDDHRRLADDLDPDWMICKASRAAQQGPLWPGQWQWMIYPIDEVAAGREWADRGVAFVETNDVGTLIRDPQLQGNAH